MKIGFGIENIKELFADARQMGATTSLQVAMMLQLKNLKMEMKKG